MTPEEILEALDKLNPQALLLEPRDVYNPALVGVTDDPKDDWTRESRVYVAVYDEVACIEAIMKWLDCDSATAEEWFGFNTSGGWAGEGTPTFRWYDMDSESPA